MAVTVGNRAGKEEKERCVKTERESIVQKVQVLKQSTYVLQEVSNQK